jgi:hypothetical protein
MPLSRAAVQREVQAIILRENRVSSIDCAYYNLPCVWRYMIFFFLVPLVQLCLLGKSFRSTPCNEQEKLPPWPFSSVGSAGLSPNARTNRRQRVMQLQRA